MNATKPDRTAPLVITEIGMCYFAALIEGLRLINEHAKDRRDLAEHFDAGALVHYVQVKGQRIAHTLYPGPKFARALHTVVETRPTVKPLVSLTANSCRP